MLWSDFHFPYEWMLQSMVSFGDEAKCHGKFLLSVLSCPVSKLSFYKKNMMLVGFVLFVCLFSPWGLLGIILMCFLTCSTSWSNLIVSSFLHMFIYVFFALKLFLPTFQGCIPLANSNGLLNPLGVRYHPVHILWRPLLSLQLCALCCVFIRGSRTVHSTQVIYSLLLLTTKMYSVTLCRWPRSKTKQVIITWSLDHCYYTRQAKTIQAEPDTPEAFGIILAQSPWPLSSNVYGRILKLILKLIT